jgi:hypothetical protein
MYEVIYSGRVVEHLRDMMARNPDHAAEILAAAQTIHKRLEIYPQFGQPLRDLTVEGAQIWIAAIFPLVVQYVIVEGDESGRRRQVWIVRPFTPFSEAGIV